MFKIKINRKNNTIRVSPIQRRVIIRGKSKRGVQGEQGEPGVGIPLGGSDGEFIMYDSSAPGNTVWQDINLDGKEDVSNKSNDSNLGTSSTFYPTQNAVKSYVDNAISGVEGSDVDSFNGRTGSVVSVSGDYTASQVTNVASGTVSSTNVQSAINEIASEKVAKGEIVVNVKDYGATGDGTTNDTAAFAAAFAAGDTIIIPEPTVAYLVQYFAVPVGKHVIGTGIRSKINIQRNGATAISIIRTDCIVENLYLNCLDADLNNNRVGIESASDVVVRNCKIEGFRHASATPNAWGIYVNDSSRVLIENCIFENNSQSDITIVDGCTNISIVGCSGSNFYVNVEPNNTLVNESLSIEDCHIARLYLLENNFLVHSIKSIVIKNCVIDELRYRGANATFIDTSVAVWYTHPTGNRYGAKLNTIGSFGFGENVNPDPFFHRVIQTGDNKTSWVYVYTPNGNTLDYKEDATRGKYLAFNPNGINTTISISRKVAVEPLATYGLKALFNTFFPTGSVATNGFRLKFYDASEVEISTYGDICFDRKEDYDGAESAWDEKTAIFETPALCAYVEITINNATSSTTSSHKLNIQRITVHKLLLDSKTDSETSELRTYSSIGPNTSMLNPVGSGGQNQSLVGQKIYTTDPGTLGYEGWVCTASGNPGTWKKMGANESTLDGKVNDTGDNMTGSLGILATGGVPTHSLTLGSGANGFAYYNTSDQTTNYERLRQYWSSDTFIIDTERAGTGVRRTLQLGTISVLKLPGASSPAFDWTRTASTTDTSAAQVRFSHAGLGAASGLQIMHQVAPIIVQSGTASYTAFDVNVTETSTGSGTRLLLNARLGGTSKFSVDRTGLVTVSNRITSVTDPTSAQDAATKAYVDSHIYGQTTAPTPATDTSAIWTASGSGTKDGQAYDQGDVLITSNVGGTSKTLLVMDWSDL